MPAAGKTGTTQNWADAWTCGFTPYYAAAFWFGFDKPGQSLGLNITGATLAGYAWADYFREIHKDLPPKEFKKPLEGVIQVTVCADSGMLPTENCGDHTTTQWFLEGTQPTEICPIHSSSSNSAICIIRLEEEMYKTGLKINEPIDDSPLKIDWNRLQSNFTEAVTDDEEDFEDEISKPAAGKNYDYNYLME